MKTKDPHFIEYWRLQFKLQKLHDQKCLNCLYYGWCWSNESSSYYTEMILKNCRNSEIKRVILKLNELLEKRNPFYYAATPAELNQIKILLNHEKKKDVYNNE